jgi:hypothetical protein
MIYLFLLSTWLFAAFKMCSMKVSEEVEVILL